MATRLAGRIKKLEEMATPNKGTRVIIMHPGETENEALVRYEKENPNFSGSMTIFINTYGTGESAVDLDAEIAAEEARINELEKPKVKKAAETQKKKAAS